MMNTKGSALSACLMCEGSESQTYEVRLLKLVVTAVANKLYMQQVIEERVARLSDEKR